jgi:hydrogenase maturation protease
VTELKDSGSTGRRRARVLVLGIGNVLMSDDGIGVHVVRELRKRPWAGVLVAEAGTALLDAAPLLGWADRALVIDAFAGAGSPGTIYWGLLDVERSRSNRCSPHELGLCQAIDLLGPRRSHGEVWVMGVEPGRVALGLDLTPALQAAVPRVADLAAQKIAEWRRLRLLPGVPANRNQKKWSIPG